MARREFWGAAALALPSLILSSAFIALILADAAGVAAEAYVAAMGLTLLALFLRHWFDARFPPFRLTFRVLLDIAAGPVQWIVSGLLALFIMPKVVASAERMPIYFIARQAQSPLWLALHICVSGAVAVRFVGANGLGEGVFYLNMVTSILLLTFFVWDLKSRASALHVSDLPKWAGVAGAAVFLPLGWSLLNGALAEHVLMAPSLVDEPYRILSFFFFWSDAAFYSEVFESVKSGVWPSDWPRLVVTFHAIVFYPIYIYIVYETLFKASQRLPRPDEILERALSLLDSNRPEEAAETLALSDDDRLLELKARCALLLRRYREFFKVVEKMAELRFGRYYFKQHEPFVTLVAFDQFKGVRFGDAFVAEAFRHYDSEPSFVTALSLWSTSFIPGSMLYLLRTHFETVNIYGRRNMTVFDASLRRSLRPALAGNTIAALDALDTAAPHASTRDRLAFYAALRLYAHAFADFAPGHQEALLGKLKLELDRLRPQLVDLTTAESALAAVLFWRVCAFSTATALAAEERAIGDELAEHLDGLIELPYRPAP